MGHRVLAAHRLANFVQCWTGASLYVLAGSATVLSVTIPDRDVSGRKAPVRMRWNKDSSCLKGSAKRSLL